MLYDENKFVISLERLDTITVHAITPKCFSCRELLTTADEICVKVEVSQQPPLRFHDGYCMQHFTLGLFTFVENRNMMEVTSILQ